MPDSSNLRPKIPKFDIPSFSTETTASSSKSSKRKGRSAHRSASMETSSFEKARTKHQKTTFPKGEDSRIEHISQQRPSKSYDTITSHHDKKAHITHLKKTKKFSRSSFANHIKEATNQPNNTQAMKLVSKESTAFIRKHLNPEGKIKNIKAFKKDLETIESYVQKELPSWKYDDKNFIDDILLSVAGFLWAKAVVDLQISEAPKSQIISEERISAQENIDAILNLVKSDNPTAAKNKIMQLKSELGNRYDTFEIELMGQLLADRYINPDVADTLGLMNE